MSLYRIHKFFFFFFFSVSVFKFSDGQSQAMGAVSLRYTLIWKLSTEKVNYFHDNSLWFTSRDADSLDVSY